MPPELRPALRVHQRDAGDHPVAASAEGLEHGASLPGPPGLLQEATVGGPILPEDHHRVRAQDDRIPAPLTRRHRP
ncbi:hypothetical protein N9L90_03275, partial [Planctomycetota bacterium]|nr:hypothetical protein [Planctomycetota bacterium]